MPWDPHRYLQFGDHRTRPAVDLLARVPAEQPALVYDLGCGPGNSTRLLVERWPESEVVGVDSSEPMLAAAREQVPQAGYLQADLGTWQPDRTASVVFSNATLHWLDDHPKLLPRVVSWVAPGGFLAVQMPRNFGSPSHRMAAEPRRGPRWRDRLASRVRVDPVASAERYYELLSPICQWVEVWETEYLHVLGGAGSGGRLAARHAARPAPRTTRCCGALRVPRRVQRPRLFSPRPP